jgi:hypothetical protein
MKQLRKTAAFTYACIHGCADIYCARALACITMRIHMYVCILWMLN